MEEKTPKTKNIIIFFSDELKKRAGGPSTYLYNLLESFKKNYKEIEENTFYIPECHICVKFIFRKNLLSASKSQNFTHFLIKKIKTGIKNIIIYWKPLARLYINISEKKSYKIFNQYKNEFSKADIIHFHSVLDFPFLKKIVGKNAIKILTVHSPASIIEEVPQEDLKFLFREEISKIEKEAFYWADGFIYPCKESLENHIKSFSFFQQILPTKKVYYCPTCIEPLKVFNNKKKIRSKYNIPLDSFLISYIGRHIEVKGFDLLGNAIMKINKNLNDNEKIYLITAGKGNLVSHFQKEENFIKTWRYIEWTEKPGDIINASDCFILLNRSCFFDLALLEAMSIGVPIITTEVGGSIFVAKKSKGIILVKPQVEDIKKAILQMIKTSEEKRKEMGLMNKKSFLSNFIQEEFAQNYINTIINFL